MKHLLHRLFWTAAVYCALAGVVLLAVGQHKLDLYQLSSDGWGFGSDLDYLLVDQAGTLYFWGAAVLVLAGWWACLAISTWRFIRKELKRERAAAEQAEEAADQWPFNVTQL